MDRDGEWIKVTNNKEEAQKCLLKILEETRDFEIKRYSEKFIEKKRQFYGV